MVFSRERILDALARLPFIDAGEMALIVGEPEAPERKRASLPDPERMARTALAFGVSPAEKRVLDLM